MATAGFLAFPPPEERGLRKQREYFQDVSQQEFLAIPAVPTVPPNRSYRSDSPNASASPKEHERTLC